LLTNTKSKTNGVAVSGTKNEAKKWKLAQNIDAQDFNKCVEHTYSEEKVVSVFNEDTFVSTVKKKIVGWFEKDKKFKNTWMQYKISLKYNFVDSQKVDVEVFWENKFDSYYDIFEVTI
jgi:hypothetical protein